jgi:hypothetical protein
VKGKPITPTPKPAPKVYNPAGGGNGWWKRSLVGDLKEQEYQVFLQVRIIGKLQIS